MYLLVFFFKGNSYFCQYCLVEMTSYFLSRNLVLNLFAPVVVQFMITLIADSLFIKILLRCFFGSSTCPCLCLLWSERYFLVVIYKFLSSNLSFMCLSFNHNIPLLLAIPYLLLSLHHLFHTFLCLHQPYLYRNVLQNFQDF